MKKKALGYIALAMAFMATTALAEIGAIRSIDRCDQYGVVLPPGDITGSLTVGDKAYFRIRLENHSSQSIWKSWNDGSDMNLRNKWEFMYGNLPIDPVQAGIKVGVYVSGRFTLADVIYVTDEPFDPSDGGGAWFTDLICSYTVQPGDLALPMTLANSHKGEAEDSETTAYFIGQGLNLLTSSSSVRLISYTYETYDSEGWITTNVKTNVCSFTFGDYWSDGIDGQLNASAQAFAQTTPGKDRTLFNAGIFIKSVDFDANTEKADDGTVVWRAVHERSTSTKEFVPSLFVPGDVADDFYGYVYLWIANTNSVMLPDATIPVGDTMVQKLYFDGTPASLQFRMRGVTQDTFTEVFLSSTVTNIISDSGRTITNFVSRPVACIAPLAPTVSVLAGGNSTYTLNATADYTNSIPFKVEFTQAWPNNEDIVVKFKYYLNTTNAEDEITAADLTKKALIALSDDQYYGYDSTLPESVTIPAGTTESIELDTNVRALYALGALTSANKGDKVFIVPYFADDRFTAYFAVKPLALTIYGMKPDVVSINGFAPADIASGETDSSLSVRGGVTSEFEVRVNDTYRNMVAIDGTNGYFTVVWQYEGGAKTTITNDISGNPLIPDGDGILHVPMEYRVPSADKNMFTTIKVMNADGRYSELQFYVFVRQPKNITATIGAAVMGEGASVPVTFTLSETSSSPSLYAYLEPLNEAASNLSYAAFFTTNTVEATARGSASHGIPFGGGELTAVSDALIAGNGLKFYDNSSGNFLYGIRLCSTPTWNPAARVTEFIEGNLVISVTNIMPVINLISGRNASNVDEDMSGTIAMSVGETPRDLRVTDVADVDADLKGTNEKQIVYRWAVYKWNKNLNAYPDVPTEVRYTIGLTETVNITNFFKVSALTPRHCGLYKFSVRAQDKDMRAGQPAFFWEEGGVWKYSPEREVDGYARANARLYLDRDPNSWGDPYEFQLRIDENPYVFLNPFGNRRSESQTGYAIFSEEDMVAEEEMGFVISLNAMPNTSGFDWIPFKVTITPEEGVEPAINPILSEEEFDFDATFYSNRFTFIDFDGTWMGAAKNKGGLYRIVAEVSDPTAQAEDGTYWANLYRPYTNYFRIENFKPTVIGDPRGEYSDHDSPTNAVLSGFHPAPGERFNFSWALEDVDSDMATNMVVTCVAGGQIVVVETNNTGSGVFTVWFDRQGPQKLQVYATDKDGDIGYSEWFYFEVQRSKGVRMYPFGPSPVDVGDDEIGKYSSQPGFGVGRVWADGVFNGIKDFMQEWTYGVEAASANLYAEGYGAGQMDTSTSADKSTAPKQNGDGVGEGDARYVNNSPFDSFFYRWFKYEPGKGGGNGDNGTGASDTEWTAGAPNPGKRRNTSLNLPMNLEGGTTYPSAAGLAVFSHEKYVEDNMGDINGDGIPDVFATRTWTSDAGESKRLYELVSGGGDGGEGETSSVNDLIDIAAYNGDGDFMPKCWTLDGNPLKPAKLGWGPGAPFKAEYEIRGVGVSGTGAAAHLGLNELGVSDYDLSPAEICALFADYAAASNVLTGVYADDYAVATNWAATTGWTPEAVSQNGSRLNPVKADTDSDGFDDGWEYYFWYYAKIGAIVDGAWGRLEGRRFDINAPATGTRISSSEIEAAFNPHVDAVGGRDFDGDGLADLEEYALGTNPIDWDSDGDGMSDLWEVMNGLDPLNPRDAGGSSGNPDGDFMARSDYEDDTFTVFTFADGRIFGLPTTTAPKVALQPATSGISTNGFLMAVEENGVTNLYIVAEQPTVGALNDDVEALPAVDCDGTIYLAGLTAVTVPAGTEVLEAADAEDEFPLISGHYGATLAATKEKVWFAEEPKVFAMDGDKVSRLAADTVGFTTFTYDGVDYLGEERTFAVGTQLSSIDGTVANITKAIVVPYMIVDGGFSWVNSKTLEREFTALALQLFNYGGDGKTFVPCALSVAQDQYVLAPVGPDDVADNPLVGTDVCKVTLIHNQVREQFGFDPRTAWARTSSGLVSSRWNGGPGDTGVATNTVAYTSLDEYLVMQFRQQLGANLMDGNRFVGSGADGVKPAATVEYFSRATTYPNIPSSGSSSSNSVDTVDLAGIRINESTHGADTDGDGVPDGWELYVNANPNENSTKYADKEDDGLNLIEEYAGVDSCNAYPDVESITKNHPGRNYGWWNKFFPTDPYSADTDDDGVLDDAEGMKVNSGRSYNVDFYVGSTWYGSVSTSFIYGKDELAESYDTKGSTICFRGGGLNPCTVDTDGDLLPDAWEFEFAGVIFKDGKPESWSPRGNDLKIVSMADGKQKAAGVDTASGYEIRGGMDGTWGPYNGPNVKGDPCFDFDHDGLLNCQEYLVQTLRHLRYDDDRTPLMGIDPGSRQFLKFMPFSAWDGEFFHQKCLDSGFTGLGSWQFRLLGYFTRPTHEWDMLSYNNHDNFTNYTDYEGKGYRVLLPPYVEIPFFGLVPFYVNGAMQYACTDPRRWDTDEDGMDDYYELFHGLNPLLGTAANPLGTDDYGWPNSRYDVIAQIHGSMANAWSNFWTDWNMDSPPPFDAMRYPWMIGTMECDADGDGLRNDEESIKANLAKPANTHTDPTPLWMTDSTSVDHASFTAQYYCFDPYIVESPDYNPNTYYPDVLGYPWDDISLTLRLRALGVAGEARTWMFSFEENEGYDTDHDFRRDTAELVKSVEMASDPKVFSDLDRRQALYFPGDRSAAMSRDGQFRRAVSSEPDLLKQFTVECWAKPEGDLKAAVLVERICNYGPSTLSNNTSVLRANFRIGIDDLGRAYGEFQGSTSNSPTARVTAPLPLTADAWVHIAFTFDGTDAKLYLNGGTVPVSSMRDVGLIPANGVSGIMQEYYSMTLEYGYVALPCATVLGASVADGDALLLNEDSTWDTFKSDSYFQGWIDEVRVWDGARTPADIHADYKKRYSMDDVKAMRSNDAGTGVYDTWILGARRATGDLPAELLQHYNFVTLPGGVEPQNVMTEPSGFQENVFDNVRKPNARALDNSLLAGWWSTTPLHSTVYWNYAVIPWIGNTVAHLPFMDGSSADSQYWATTLAGAILPGTQGFTSYDYPNEANPYPYFMFHRERNNRLNLLGAVESGASGTNDSVLIGGNLTGKWSFQLRSEFLGTSDLVPLGGAYARRGTDFWDGQGAMDAWAETSAAGEVADTNGNGIPDWAEDLGYTTAEAYLAALREGLLPDGTTSDAYVDVADVDANGILDWWERLYGISGFSGNADPDNDGLSIMAEYSVVGEPLFGDNVMLDPLKDATDGLTLDYFRRTTNGWYYGEVLTDHDFIEDWWEDRFSVDAISRYVYDALTDADGDGWSNWAERRANTDPSVASVLAVGEQELPAYPIPVVEVDLSLESGTAVNGTVVVQAWSSSMLQGKPDAVWHIAAGTGQTVTGTKLLGMNPKTTVTLQLGPGSVVPDTVSIEFCDPAAREETYNVASNGTKTLVQSLSNGTGPWAEILKDAMHADDASKGDIVHKNDAMVVGSIDYATGIVTVDFSKLAGYNWRTWYSDSLCWLTELDRSYVRVGWSSKMLSGSAVTHLYLVDTTEGHLREGKNTIIAFLDVDGNGRASEGEPFGMVKDVDVGWNRVVDLPITLTSDSAVMPRTWMPSYSEEIPVRITRTSINGESAGNRVVFKRSIDFTGRAYLSEGDIIRSGKFDLDWATLARDAEAICIKADDIAEVGYKVSIGEGEMAYDIRSFVKEFPAERIAPVTVRPSVTSGYKVFTTRPEFVWTSDAGYTAFVLEIATNAAADAVVWSSGTNILPASTMEGFIYRAPAFVGRDLEDGVTYFWRVAQLNAKWPTTGPVGESGWSDWAEFKTEVDSTGCNTGYGRLSVDVRYYGAADSGKGDVMVAAYATPDFTGAPEAALRLPEGDLADLAVTNVAGGFVAVCTNNLVTFDGLKPGSYYVMAFIDRNGNGRRDAFETWGYANLMGQGVENMYDPVSVAVSATAIEAPATVVFMEDTDINQNDELDCFEDLALMESAVKAVSSDDDDENETWSDWAGGFDLDVASDAAFAAEGDVMAYATTNVWLVALDDGTEFLIPVRSPRPQVGDEASGYSLWSTYRYGWGTNYVNGVGSNATAKAGARILSVFDVEAALVHAQVYDTFGYNPLTANPAAYADGSAVNTKPFTALDKYLMIRYFEQLGLCTEEDVNTNRLWSSYSLIPGDPDCNKDGIPDGWELYVMFGNAAKPTTLAEAKVSPFAEIGGVPAAQYVRDAANTPLSGSQLTILEEFDYGNVPTDPWQLASLGLDGATDADAYRFRLKTAADQLSDEDNDGLSNWAEYLANVDGTAVSMTNSYSSGTVLDYFQRVTRGDLTSYLGWFYADHDFMEDWWEDGFDVDMVSRYAYDAHRDSDGDGWSNWAEVRALTAPDRSATLSLVRSDGTEDHALAAYPVPTVRAKVSYNSSSAFDSQIVVKAWKGSSVAGTADATWIVAGSGGESAWNDRFLGLAPNRKMKFNIGPGDIAQSHVKIEFYDPNYYIETINYETNGTIKEIVYTDHNIDTSAWGIFYYGDDPSIEANGRNTGSLIGGWVNYVNGDIEIDFSHPTYRQTDATYSLKAGKDQDVIYHYDLTRAFWRVSWMGRLAEEGNTKSFSLSEASEGYLREGRNTFLAFADLDGNGELTPGEPSGFVRDVDVGWDHIPNLSIELKDESSIFPTFTVESTNEIERVRIYRTSVNGEQIQRRLVWKGDVNLSKESWLSEMNFVGADTYDIDWKLGAEAVALYGVSPADLAYVGYTVYVGRGTNAVAMAEYEKRFSAAVPELVAPREGAGYLVRTSQPEFRWKGTSTRPAYILQVASDEGFADLVYVVTNFMPAATSDGFAVKPALWVGDKLADNTEYFWRVAAIDARNGVGGAEPSWSTAAKFKTDVDSTNRNTGYGKAAVEVRYYGASTNTLSDVIVGAYATADFSGLPAARVRLDGDAMLSTLARADNLTAETFMTPVTNVCFDGLAPGDYYVMAFVDANGNGKRDPYETWGYVNNVGTESAALYSPVALTVSSAKIDIPAGIIFMEDTDINQNEKPDCLEDQTELAESIATDDEDDPSSGGGGSGGGGSGGGGSGGGGSTDPLNDEDGDGLPDTYEEDNGLDPDDPSDAEFVADGDVMAYAVTNLTVVTVWDGSNPASATNKYAVMDVRTQVKVGDDASALTNLRTVYNYGGPNGGAKYALGMAATASGRVYAVDSNAEVVLVHAQVYEFFGFDPTTANPVAYAGGSAVNTKPFTALDKYLFFRYLEKAYGLADETAMVTNSALAAAYTLTPGIPDCNRDGVPDGWELYVMFGTDLTAASLDAVKIAPFPTLYVNGVEMAAYDYVRNTTDVDSALDGDGVSIFAEYDEGDMPTDPWQAKTFGDVSDKDGHDYHLKGYDAVKDFDNDGLPNYAEYLVSEVFKFGELDPDNPYTDGRKIDYFRRAGKLYLGELFTDHDFMEDHFEKEWSEIGADPAYYDAHLDSDINGWSNWAEVRSHNDPETWVQVGTTTNNVVLTFDVGTPEYGLWIATNQATIAMKEEYYTGSGWITTESGGEHLAYGATGTKEKERYTIVAEVPVNAYGGHPLPEVKMTVHYNGTEDLTGRTLTVQSYTDGDLNQSDATFYVANGDNRNVNTLTFKNPSDGYLREGKNTFVVMVGGSSNETDSASMIMGVVRNVDVGWSKVEFEVELLEDSPVCPRPVLAYSTGEESTDASSSSESTETTSSHVYVYRYAVDEMRPPSALVNRLILDKDVGDRTYLYEGDFLANGGYDIDWEHFRDEVVLNSTVYGNEFPVTSVTYRVYSQPVNIATEAVAVSNITPYVEFTREFGATRATAVPVSPGSDTTIFYEACPTFTWRMTGDRPDTYTAFAIQVKDADGTVIWNSGTQLAPPRNAKGHYVWKAPLYVGDQTSAGKVFANGANYSWRVTMYNAKWQGASWSDDRAFRMNVYGADELNNTDRHRINVKVKYYGPGAFNTSASKTDGTIRVEAFTSPDFSGAPAGRTFVRNAASVTNDGEVVNATIVGLNPGTYYVRAYIDTTGNFGRGVWESWGYACPRGDAATSAIYTPTAFEIDMDKPIPTALVYIEDCDTDQDCLPDVWEYDKTGGGTNWLLTFGPVDNDHNGYISVNPQAAISDLINGGNSITLRSAGQSGMPKALAALMLGVDSVDPAINSKTLSIRSLALADGVVKLMLGAQAEDPAAGTVFVTDGIVRATVVVKYADSLGGEWKSVEKYIEKKIEDGAVSEELTFSLEELGLDASKGFFKVELKQ